MTVQSINHSKTKKYFLFILINIKIIIITAISNVIVIDNININNVNN